MNEDDFLVEVHRLAIELEFLIEKYDLRDRVLSMMVVGVLDELEDDDEKSNIFGRFVMARATRMALRLASVAVVQICHWNAPKTSVNVLAASSASRVGNI